MNSSLLSQDQAARQQLFSLHPAQENVYFEQLLHPRSAMYNLGWISNCDCVYDLNLLQQSWVLLYRHVDALRLQFVSGENAVIQQRVKTIDSRCCAVEFEDFCAQVAPYESALQWTQQQVDTPSNYLDGETTKLVLIKLAKNRAILFTRIHHLMIDGVGLALLHRLLHRIYRCLEDGASTLWLQQLPQYYPQVRQAQHFIATEAYQQSREYWLDFFKYRQPLHLKAHYREHEPSPRLAGRQHRSELPPQLGLGLEAFCQQHKVSPLAVISGVCGLYFARAESCDEVVLTTAVHGRDGSDVKDVIGMFSNLVPLSCRVPPHVSFITLIKTIKTDLKSGRKHRRFAASHLTRKMGAKESSRADVQVIYDALDSQGSNALITSLDNVDPLVIRLVDCQGEARFYLNLVADGGYFTRRELGLLTQRLLFILEQGLTQPNEDIGNISLLPADEQRRLMQYSEMVQMPISELTLVEYFARQVDQTPEQIAVVCGDQQLSYMALDKQSSQLAQLIRSQYQAKHHQLMGTDTLIPLYFDRCIEMVIGILAVLKAGGAYVPMSPEYPQARTSFIIEDTKASLILTQTKLHDTLATWCHELEHDPVLITLDEEVLSLDLVTTDCFAVNDPHSLAYVIYTSSTTSKPKGVMVEHHSVVNLIEGVSRNFDFGSDERVLWLASYTFDASVEQLFLTLLNGARLYIPDLNQIKEPNQIKQLVSEHQITHVHATPGYLAALDEFGHGHHLRRVVSGGDVIDERLRQIWTDKLVNEYGPTETTVTASQCLDYYQKAGMNCIGTPLHNSCFYVLDHELKWVPCGLEGELYIGGAGVARGYLNLPQLSAQSFVNNPFSADGLPRLYKTGDRVRWLDDGALEYLGRYDNQLKIRGYRVEPGEIETALTEVAPISQAVVIAREVAGEPKLAAYVVVQPDQQVDNKLLRLEMSKCLPPYMVPATFTQLEQIPLTVNGKLDRDALPTPEFVDTNAYVAPQNALERQLVEIWQQVLGLERVGVTDSFFGIGGDSLSAMRMAAMISQSLKVDLPLDILFDQPNIIQLAIYLRRSGEHPHRALIRRMAQKRYPLSFAQAQLWFIEQFGSAGDAYHVPYLLQLMDAQIDRLSQAVNVVVGRHPVLNGIYVKDEHQHVYQQLGNEPLVVELCVIENEAALWEQMAVDVVAPFDLTKTAGLRLHHYQLKSSEYLLLLFHHSVCDAWSLDIFIRELTEVYMALSEQRTPQLPKLDISYGDHALWQREQLQQQELEPLVAYWQQQLAGFSPLNLLGDFTRPVTPDHRGADVDFIIEPELTSQLRLLARSQQSSLYTVLLSGWYVCLAALSGQTDVVLGTVMDNRQHPQTQPLIGLFVNSVVLRADVSVRQSIAELLAQVHQVVLQAKTHQHLPFEKLVDSLKLERDSSRHPIFQVMFVLQNFNHQRMADKSHDQLPFAAVNGPKLYHPAKFDLTLALTENKNQMGGVLNYATSIFTSASVERMTTMYQLVLQAFVDINQLSRPIGEIALLSEEERQTLLYRWGPPTVAYPQAGLAQLFEAQVMASPDHLAVVYEQQQLSYAELNQRANQLAWVIRDSYQKQVGKAMPADTLIALHLQRSVEMVIAMLAVIKAGGAYVPVSPLYPPQRVKFMIKGSGCVMVLTMSQHQATLDFETVLALDELELPSSSKTLVNPEPMSSIDSLAYVIYTSGTTGQPKGVLTPARGVVSLLTHNQQMDLNSDDVLLHLSDPYFDAATFEVWGALLNGAKLVITPANQLIDPGEIARLLQQYQINVLWLTKSLFDQLYMAQPGLFAHLRCLLIGGEPLNPDLLRRLINQELRPQRILNGYGPTESTVFATLWQAEGFHGSVPIGQATNNRQLYVLNERMQPVGIGCPGELYIGGDGLARGYLNQPRLSEQSFVKNPFVADAGARLYKSGDKVRWMVDGNLQYLGRFDNQLKIRGFRIEPEEIETALVKLPQVSQAVVRGCEMDGVSALVAYLVGQPMDNERLTAHLAMRLPAHMLPSSFIFIDKIPLTPNGKLDWRALPEVPAIKGDNYLAPANPLEQQLCEIWQQVLAHDRLGVLDNFFSCGGNSISAVRLCALMSESVGVEVQLAWLFTNPSIRQLAGVLNVNQQQQPQNHIVAQSQASYELSFAQQRLWFIEQFEQGCDRYNIPYLVKLKGADLSRLLKAINQLADRQRILKTVYFQTRQDQHQRVLNSELGLTQYTVADMASLKTQVEENILQPFDLTVEPGLKLFHYRFEADDQPQQYMLFLFHHISFDGWSLEIFNRELAEIYQALSEKRKVHLPLLHLNYGDHARWQRQQLKGERLESLLDYWCRQLQDFETLELATDHVRPSKQDHQGQAMAFELEPELVTQLRHLAQARQTTVFTVLLSGFYYTLSQLSGQTDVVIGTSSDNREQSQSQQLIGLFANALVLRAQVDASQSVEAMLAQVHQLVTQAKVHQALPFEQLLEALDVQRDGSRHPIFQVMFSLQSFAVDMNSGEQPLTSSLPFESVLFDDQVSLHSPAKVDLNLSLNEHSSHIDGLFTFATSLFTQASISKMISIYRRVLTGLVAVENLNRPIAEIELLSPTERQAQLSGSNASGAVYPPKTIAQAFIEQVNKTAEETAVVFGDLSMTYAELDRQSELLAGVIIEHFNQRQLPLVDDTLIPLYFERSLDMLVAILAVLKVGGAYVPISPDHPKNRVVFILKDIDAQLLLTHHAQVDELDRHCEALENQPEVILVDQTFDRPKAPVTLPQGKATNLAYVIYTSGNTGRPKGVMIEQQGVVNLISTQQQNFAFDASERVLWLASYSFDASIEQIFLPLLTGARVYIPSDDLVNDAERLKVKIRQWEITHLHATPGYLTTLGEFAPGHCLRRVISGGDVIPSTLKQMWAGKLINEYGPTETTVTAVQCVHHCQCSGVNCIGHPLAAVEVYVLGDNLQLLPIGAPGQLYIGGAGVARGYLNLPELTAARFITNPFGSSGGSKLYRTGDRVRWRVDGNLEYLGRNDNQLKICGFRIEAGEIEAALCQLPYVHQALAMSYRQGDDNQLVAYVVPLDGVSLDEQAISEGVAAKLPSYMHPASYIFLDKIPLTVNGKLDRKALPAPQFVAIDSYQPPRDVMELQLVEIWQQELELERVGINDNLFQIGGNSVSAIRLVAKMTESLGMEVPLVVLFEQPNIKQLATFLRDREALQPQVVIPHVIQARYPLSLAQQRLWFIEQYEQGSVAYHLPFLVKLIDADLESLESAVNKVVERHPVLNSLYVDDGQEVYQQVSSQMPLWSHCNIGPDQSLAMMVQADINKPFDLTRQCALKLIHYQDGEQDHLLMIFHQIAFDGWSLEVFNRELGEFYAALTESQSPKLEQLNIVYGDYALWQRRQMSGEKLAKLEQFWRQQLQGYSGVNLSCDFARPSKADNRGRNFEFELDLPLSKQLRELAKTQQTSLYTLLLSGFYVTVAALSGQTDIVLGTVAENRQHGQTQKLIGLFVNSLVLRTRVEPRMTIVELLSEVHRVVMQAKVHQELPFEKLVELLNVARDTSRHPIFQLMFGVQDLGADSASREKLPFGMVDTPLASQWYSPAKFDISLIMDESQEQLHGVINYATSLFALSTIERVATIYQQVLIAFVDKEQQNYPLGAIELVSQDVLALYQRWNDTQVDQPQTHLLSGFEQQLAEHGSNTAVICDSSTTSYFKLNGLRLALAHRLGFESMQYQPGEFCAILAEQGVLQVAGVLAVLSLRGAYVPLSIDWPAQRLHDVLLAAKVEKLLLTRHQYKKLQRYEWLKDYEFLILEDAAATVGDASWQHQVSKALPKVQPSDCAYVLFTSSNTGEPQGVMITHQSVSNTLTAVNREFALCSSDRVLGLSDLCLSLSVYDIFAMFACGGAVVYGDEHLIHDPCHWLELIQAHGVTVFNGPPHLTQMLADQVEQATELARLRLVLISGDWVPMRLPPQLKKLRSSLELVSLGGASEASIWSIWFNLCGSGMTEWRSIPYGLAMPNQQVWILDHQGRHCPLGVKGEIYIGGLGVGKGYFNRQQQTDESFIHHPKLGRLYRTGDRGIWHVQGYIEFCGREDQQVKIDGFRVELEEVQLALAEIPLVEQALVVDWGEGMERYLAAYIVQSEHGSLELEQLAPQLAQKLPAYMVPKTYMLIDHIPLTDCGAVDREQLPHQQPQGGLHFVAPADALEQQLVELCQQALEVESLGIEDNFFDLGANSILAIRLAKTISEALEVELPLALLFEQPTVVSLAAYLRSQDEVEGEQRITHVEQASYPLSFEQQYLWSVERLHPGHGYHLPYLIKLKQLQPECLLQGVNMIAERHRVLNSHYASDDSGAQLQWLSSQPLVYQQRQVPHQEALVAVLNSDIHRAFDLNIEPGLKLFHYVLAGEHYVLMVFHQMACDQCSLTIFAEQLSEVCMALSEQREPQLINLDIYYGDHARWQRQQQQGEHIHALQRFWRSQLQGYQPFSLAAKQPLADRNDSKGHSLTFELEGGLTKALRQLAAELGVGLDTVMLSGLYLTVATLSGQEDMVIGTPTENRPLVQTEQMIGLFTNVLPLRFVLESEQEVGELLTGLQAMVAQARSHQSFGLEQIVEVINADQQATAKPLCSVMFVMEQAQSELADGLELPYEVIDLAQHLSIYPLAKMDLSLRVIEAPSELKVELNYPVNAFALERMERLAHLYLQLLAELACKQNRTVAIGKLSLLSATQTEDLLKACAPQPWQSPTSGLIAQFEQQVKLNPHRQALACGQNGLNYGQLNRLVNRLARLIRKHYEASQGHPLTKDTLIGLYFERDQWLLVGILAVLKTGAAYVPIGTDQPQARLEIIINDIQAALILTSIGVTDKLQLQLQHQGASTEVLTVDETLLSNAIADTNLNIPREPQDLAYVIYTSGSSGTPKGVMVEYGALTHSIGAIGHHLFASQPLDGALSTLSLSQYTFDIFALEYGLTLSCGGLLVLSDLVGAGAALQRCGDQINFIQQTPSMWQMLLCDPNFVSAMSNVGRHIQIMVGGESGSAELYQRLEQYFAKVHQVYGPTETCIWSTVSDYQSGLEAVIGRPFSGEQVYLMSKTMQLLPMDAPGQIYITGNGLARGYLNEPELTQHGFIESPIDGQRWYKTGDWGRWRGDGQLEFLGRFDDQIKLRGHRIELAEIEQSLKSHPGVDEAVVVFDSLPGNERLLAYVGKLEPELDLRQWLTQRLPDYMIPALVIQLDSWPLNASGKIHRQALPKPEVNEVTEALEPAQQWQVYLQNVWQQLLQIDEVALDDSFFDLGGHSLLMTQLKKQLDSRLDQSVPLVSLFQYPTIRELAVYLSELEQCGQAPVQVPEQPNSATSEFAIVGMSGRFPGASDLDEFWLNLRDGVSSIHHYSDEQLIIQGLEPQVFNHPDYVRAGGWLADCERFDAQFFDYSPLRAQIIDPQQRLLLQASYAAVEHGGWDVSQLVVKAGVFVTVGSQGYLEHHLKSDPQIVSRMGLNQLSLANDKDYVASRIAFKLGLTGPALTVQTACSSALVAVHMACQSLAAGECELALAGGAAIKFPQQGYAYQVGMNLSPDGHCRAFDADAQGSVPGGGVGLVLLARRAWAESERATIHALIKATAIAHDGSDKTSFTLPCVNGQAAVVAAAMKGIDFESVSYIEAHGIGTLQADSIEMAALSQAYRRYTDRQGYCALGSVKANIGHLDVASGIAGLLKTVLALKNRQLPPSIEFTAPDPTVDWSSSPFYVNHKLIDWRDQGPLRAGVNAFGTGGTNAHVVLEQAPAPMVEGDVGKARSWQLLCLSAKTKQALSQMGDNLFAHLQQPTTLADVAYTLNIGRQDFAYRQYWLVEEGKQAVKMEHQSCAAVVDQSVDMVWMFPGQGSQYVNMGVDLYHHEPVFKRVVEECAEILKDYLGLDLIQMIYPSGSSFDPKVLASTCLTQPALFICEYGLARLLLAWGLKPQIMLGHSVGEYVSACLAGVFSLRDCLELMAIRGRLMQAMPSGQMLSVGLSAKRVESILPESVTIAAINAPEQTVVAGPAAGVASFISALADIIGHDGKPVAYKPLQTSHAFHSPMMAPVVAEYRRKLQSINLNPPQQRLLSNVSGDWMTNEQATSVDYWCEQLLQPVRFATEIETLLAQTKRSLVFVEVGPGNGLCSLLEQQQGLDAISCLGLSEEQQSDQALVLDTLGQLWLRGIKPDWNAFYTEQAPRRIPLPTYAFARESHWVEPHRSVNQDMQVIDSQFRTAIENAYLQVCDGSFTNEMTLDAVKAHAAEAIQLAMDRQITQVIAQLNAQGATADNTEHPLLVDHAYSDGEYRVAQVFQQILGLDEFSVVDDFFALGGDSLLVVQLLAKLKTIGINIDMTGIINGATIRAIAAWGEKKALDKGGS